MTRRDLLRILDANFNRSREGLRVCEEITRFALEDKRLTVAIKKARHELSDCLRGSGVGLSELLAARDVRSDVGKKPEPFENVRQNRSDIFAANIERAKEALRVLEEASKLVAPALSERFKKIRFRVYAIEKNILPKLETLRHHRSGGLERPRPVRRGSRSPRRRR